MGDHVGDDPTAVAENRSRIASSAGLDRAEGWVWLSQVHGTTIHEASTAPSTSPVADAAITQTRGLPLAIVTADCAPVVIACDDTLAVVHAGHRGLGAGIIERAVDAVRARGRGPLAAYLGPCIHAKSYEFGEADLAPLVERFGAAVAAQTTDGHPALDIPAAVRVALERSGIDAFTDSNVCTATSPNHFSYRRDGTTGRQVTVAVLP